MKRAHSYFLSVALAVLASVPTSTVLSQTIVNINAQDYGDQNPFLVPLDAGWYTIDVVGTSTPGANYDAWNAWGYTTCTDPNGSPPVPGNTGWLDQFVVLSTNISNVSIGGQPITSSGGFTSSLGLVYPDPATALAAASGPSRQAMFLLNASGQVGFGVTDPIAYLSDNLGGVSLRIAPASVPEPSSLALLLLGALDFVARRWRNHRT